MRKLGMHLQRDWPPNESSAYAAPSCQHHIIVKIILAIVGGVLLGIPGAFVGGYIGKKIDQLIRLIGRQQRADR